MNRSESEMMFREARAIAQGKRGKIREELEDLALLLAKFFGDCATEESLVPGSGGKMCGELRREMLEDRDEE